MAVRTNVIENSSFENNITDFWSTFGTGTATHSRDATVSLYGGASYKLNSNGINTDAGLDRGFTSGLAVGTWYLSGWIKTQSITGDAKLVVRRNTDFGADISLTISNTPDTRDWTRVSGSFVVDTPGVSRSCLFGLGPYGTPSQGIAWFDGIMLEMESTLVDYYDGSIPDGGGYQYDWLGSTFNSQSTRTDVVPPKGGNMPLLNVG